MRTYRWDVSLLLAILDLRDFTDDRGVGNQHHEVNLHKREE
jgi:hypothetical protein